MDISEMKLHSTNCLVNSQCVLVAIIIVLIIVCLKLKKDLIDNKKKNRLRTVSWIMIGRE